jgi:hypothetical protein
MHFPIVQTNLPTCLFLSSFLRVRNEAVKSATIIDRRCGSYACPTLITCTRNKLYLPRYTVPISAKQYERPPTSTRQRFLSHTWTYELSQFRSCTRGVGQDKACLPSVTDNPRHHRTQHRSTCAALVTVKASRRDPILTTCYMFQNQPLPFSACPES